MIGTPTRPFAAKALLVQGEMWLTAGEQTRRLRVGDGFELARERPHSKRCGEAGAIDWVGRRNAG
ncbi:MAG: hypothetical protein WAQ05_16925 [Rubrivivax sp.]